MEELCGIRVDFTGVEANFNFWAIIRAMLDSTRYSNKARTKRHAANVGIAVSGISMAGGITKHLSPRVATAGIVGGAASSALATHQMKQNTRKAYAAHYAEQGDIKMDRDFQRPVGARKVSSHQPDRSIDKHPSMHPH